MNMLSRGRGIIWQSWVLIAMPVSALTQFSVIPTAGIVLSLAKSAPGSSQEEGGEPMGNLYAGAIN